MSEFRIGFTSFTVFVHHRQGLTAVFGGEDHRLIMKVGDQTTPIPAGKDIRLMVKRNGVEVPAGGETESHVGGYIPDIRWITGRPSIALDPEKVIGSNRGGQNGRVHVSGGRLMEHPSVGLEGRTVLTEALWSFQEFGAAAPALHRLTNHATFQRTIQGEEEYELRMGDDGSVIPLIDGAAVEFENAELEECAGVPESFPGTPELELPKLFRAVGLDPGSAKATIFSLFKDPSKEVRTVGRICQPCANIVCHQEW